MATYIVLSQFTDQGIRNIKESPARLEAAHYVMRKNLTRPSRAGRCPAVFSGPPAAG